MDFLQSHRWLIKDTHGIDFFLGKEFIKRLQNTFGIDYSDEELINFFHSSPISEFVPSLIKHCNPAAILDYTTLNYTSLSEKAFGMKEKKLYEVVHLGALVESTAKEAQTSYLVDFGGGLGHMASHMTLLGFRVIVVDCEEKLLNKLPKDISSIRIFLTESNLSELEEKLNAALDGKPCLFYSLHACGSLSDCMIELFCRMTLAKAIVNVGCCYNKIKYSIGQTRWSMNEKMAACQCPLIWKDNVEDTKRSFGMNFYRAIVQDVAKNKGFELEKPKLGNMKLLNSSDHPSYFQQIYEKSGLFVEPHDYDKYDTYKRLYSTWWTVRAVLGQLIEAQIIKERVEYIIQKHHIIDTKTFRIFDIRKSPRNYAIVAHQ